MTLWKWSHDFSWKYFLVWNLLREMWTFTHATKLTSGRNKLVKGQCTIYRPHFFFHVDKIIDQPHLSKRIPSVSFKFISCQKICRYYVEMSNCNLCITRCFKFQVEEYRSVPLKFESELLYLVKKKSNPFWRY